MKRLLQILSLLLIFPFFSEAQVPFSVELVPVTISNSPAIHSFAYAQHDGKWVFMCGRTNGLHGFVPPPGPFPSSGENINVAVVDKGGNTTYYEPVTALPATIDEQLRSTNPQFYQEGSTLYIIGGFAHAGMGVGFTTLDYLTAVDVPGVIDAVINGTSLTPHFRQISDARLRDTGGELRKIGDYYYLIFGHDWQGGYNRNDPNVGSQEYLNEIRRFKIVDDGTNLSIADYSAWRDTVAFHRRDLTVINSVKTNGEPILEALGGVFRPTVDYPYLKPITIDSTGAAEHPSFEQMTSQYTAATLALFDSTTGDRYSVLFGGIGVYYFDDATQSLLVDSMAPFVDNITVLTKNSVDVWQETILGTKMPGLLGSNAVIIMEDNLPYATDGVVRFDQLTGRTLVGHFFGGIAATQPNNGPTSANGQIYEVYVTPGATSAQAPAMAVEEQGFRSYPNPTRGQIFFEVEMKQPGDVKLDIFDVEGRAVMRLAETHLGKGTHTFEANMKNLADGVYIARLGMQPESRFIRFQYISK